MANGNQLARLPVSVEAVRGYLDAATQDLGIKDDNVLGNLLTDLSNKVHPLVLGEIFRSRTQIRFLAEKLLNGHVKGADNVKAIVDFLCADSGSHDYTINRREAESLGLPVEKPSAAFYDVLKALHRSYSGQMHLTEPYTPMTVVGPNKTIDYQLVRGVIESVDCGSYGFVSEGQMSRTTIQLSPTDPPQEQIQDQRTFEGWKAL